tara:strand:- start:1018 stop:1452 length:435 start_codon:yes stop_codon:yes gene_type:complete
MMIKEFTAWDRRNPEIDKELSALKSAKGAAYDELLAKLDGRIAAMAALVHAYLVKTGWHDDTHPALLEFAFIRATEHRDPYREPGRPSEAQRNEWITARAAELIAQGMTKTQASKKLTAEVEDRFEVVLSYRTILNLLRAQKTT